MLSFPSNTSRTCLKENLALHISSSKFMNDLFKKNKFLFILLNFRMAFVCCTNSLSSLHIVCITKQALSTSTIILFLLSHLFLYTPPPPPPSLLPFSSSGTALSTVYFISNNVLPCEQLFCGACNALDYLEK